MAKDTPVFGALLDKDASAVEKPKPLPPGTYSTIIVGQPRYDKSAKKQTEFVEFTHKMLSAGEDVDEGDLKEALTSPDGNVRQLNEVLMKNTFYITENSLWRLKDFLKDVGFDVDEAGTSLREMCESCAGKSVGVFVKHEPSQDGQTFFAKIDRTVAAE